MPLIPAPLQNALLQMTTTSRPQSASEAADRIATAYEAYTLTALAGGIPLTAPGPGRAAMSQALTAAFSTKPGLPPVVAQGFATMVTSYWVGATFILPPASGVVVTPPPGIAALVPTLSALFANPANPAEVFAAQVALALDVCTRTVLVTLTVPPAPPVIVPVL